ncbi:MAG: peptidoglycan D,D-transpeptidase FtsI family protein [Alcanivorax sp.]
MWQHARYRSIVIDGDRRSAVSMAQSRLSFLGVCFMAAYIIMAVRLLDLGIVQAQFLNVTQNDNSAETVIVRDIADRRGDVYDRNGFLVATTLKTPSLFVDPSLVLDEASLLKSLVAVLPDLDLENAVDVVTADNRFGWLAYNITPEQQQRILEIGDPSLGFKYNYTRVYPQGPLFSHMLGYTDRDGLGLAGVERSYDDVLARGDDVVLALDLRLQHAVKREVARAMSDFNAKAGVGLVLDAKSGELLAGVSLPDFDLNEASTAKDWQKFNRISLGVYELGSMFKAFSTAALLELEKVGMDYTFDARKPLKVGWFTIRDYHAQKRILTVAEVFMHSSNIGSALMGQMVGGEALRAFYRDLGLMDKLRFDVREVGAPILPNPWREDSTMTVSFGHGMATSPLQMSAAMAMIVNGGFYVQPKVAKSAIDDKKAALRVLSEETSEKMRQLLRLVVVKGTGRKADVKGVAIGGKTGTAEKSIGGRYHRDKLISSFVGAFPIDDPKYIVMVMVDEPKGNKSSYGYATAGWVAAPAVKRIVQSMVSILGLPADQYDPDQDIALDVLPYIHEKPKKGKRLASYD